MNSDATTIENFLERSGCSDVVETLHGGLSDSSVFRVIRDGTPAVLKCQKDRRELAFLTEYAPATLGSVDWLPKVLDFGETGSLNWLLIEYIPNAWPENRRNTDPVALSILRALHSTSIGPTEFDWDNSEWTVEQLNVAQHYLPAESFHLLQNIHAAYLARKMENLAICSGDPNSPNWLIRSDGQPVLIDWQIATIANRALDLAGWMSTFIDYAEIKRISAIYLGDQVADEEVRRLAIDISIYFGRRCSMNFWRAERSHDPSIWRSGIEHVQQVIPGWLSKLDADIGG